MPFVNLRLFLITINHAMNSEEFDEDIWEEAVEIALGAECSLSLMEANSRSRTPKCSFEDIFEISRVNKRRVENECYHLKRFDWEEEVRYRIADNTFEEKYLMPVESFHRLLKNWNHF